MLLEHGGGPLEKHEHIQIRPSSGEVPGGHTGIHKTLDNFFIISENGQLKTWELKQPNEFEYIIIK